MIKQFLFPGFFLIFSCADLHREEILKIIDAGFLMMNLRISNDELKVLNYFEKYNLLNANPVILAHHIQHSVSLFFQRNLYAMRKEFQVKGAPHLNRTVLLSKQCIFWRIHLILLSVQICLTKSKIWNNSRTYRKNRNKPCRFHYGRFLLKKNYNC